ncbi:MULTISPECIES: phage tail protein [Enterobacteriaceae]|uniref:phage tail protein n=1 Tax=Enterobacteriaceae TaxID=543 RepID=UPI002796B1DB|nr:MULTISPECIES: phage tail protein [Enterobacteriaceae]MDQ1792647.1 phage tail protein [Klebsiella pneumoniae subsp. pneumoniae]
MTAKYFAILTNQGAARLANAAALGTKLNLTQMAVGDANGVLPTPDPAQTKLINQKRIAPLNLLTVDPANTSQIIAEQIIPENEGGFWIREIGLYDDDGILIAVANCPETYKPQLQEGSGRTQTIRMILIVSSTSAITLKIDPSVVLATRQYVDEKVIEVKTYTGSALRMHEQSRNHPDASTSEKGFVKLNSSTVSDSEATAATSKAVKIAMDNASARLARDRNLSDLPNIPLARQNLGLGEASTRGVGTGTGQLPDMAAFGVLRNGQNSWDTLPNGIIRQVGVVSLTPVGNFNSSELGGVTYYTHYYRVIFPKAFPNAQISTIATLASYSYQNQNPMAGKYLAVHRDTDSGQDVSKTRFTVAYTTTVLGEVPTIHYEATGY